MFSLLRLLGFCKFVNADYPKMKKASTDHWEIMSKSLMSWAGARAMKVETSEGKRFGWTMLAMTGIPSWFLGWGKLYRLKNTENTERKVVYSSNDYQIGARISEVDWEFEVQKEK